MLEVGQPCPTFTTTLDNGDTLTTDQLIGQPFVIFFYPKADTPGCTKESIAFSALKPQFDALGVRVLGASKDKAAKQDKFKSKHNLTVELIADDESDVCDQFGVWQEKSMYGKTYMASFDPLSYLIRKANAFNAGQKSKSTATPKRSCGKPSRFNRWRCLLGAEPPAKQRSRPWPESPTESQKTRPRIPKYRQTTARRR